LHSPAAVAVLVVVVGATVVDEAAVDDGVTVVVDKSLDDLSVPTLLHRPAVHADDPVFARLAPMQPCTMDSSVRPA
jgi:hypothetical protein